MCSRMTNRNMKAFLRGFGYAASGIAHCLRQERNFRFHMAAGLYVLMLAPYFELSRGEWAALILTIGLVMAAEALNTAVEILVDRLSPNRCDAARVVKDVAAGAVLLCAGAAVGVAIALFTRADGWAAMGQDFTQQLWKPILLALSLPAAGWLVFRNYS